MKLKPLPEKLKESVYWNGSVTDSNGIDTNVVIYCNPEIEFMKKLMSQAEHRFCIYNDDLYIWNAYSATHDTIISNFFGYELAPKITKGIFRKNKVSVNKEGFTRESINKLDKISNSLYDGEYDVDINTGL